MTSDEQRAELAAARILGALKEGKERSLLEDFEITERMVRSRQQEIAEAAKTAFGHHPKFRLYFDAEKRRLRYSAILSLIKERINEHTAGKLERQME